MTKKTESSKNEDKAQASSDAAPDSKDVREGRKSLTMPSGKGAKNKVRYVEGTKALKDGCWLSGD